MTTLNDDIVLHILSFLDPKALDLIHEAHPVFHAAWMQGVYEKLDLESREEAKSKLVDPMLREAAKAGYVKKVEVRPWRVQPHTKSPRSWTEKLLIGVSKLIIPDYTKKQAVQRLKKRLTKDSMRITEAFASMRGVQEYTILWDEGRFHSQLFKACLTPLDSARGSGGGWQDQLVKLSITIPPRFMDSLASVRLNNLHTLEYHFATGKLSATEITTVHHGFLVFLGNLKDTLRNLSFHSACTSQNLDMSQLFADLASPTTGRFEQLEAISVSIPLDGAHLSVPGMFVQFLHKHRHTLRQICLLTSRPGARVGPAPVGCADFVDSILSSIHNPLPRLRALKVALPRHASLDVFRHFLALHSSTLENLTLVDRAFGYQDMKRMLTDPQHGIVGLSLTELEMRANALSAELLFLLAAHLSQLRMLKVDYSAVTGREADSNLPHFCTSVETFGNLRFAGWGLQQFVIKPPRGLHLVPTIRPDLQARIPHLQVTEE